MNLNTKKRGEKMISRTSIALKELRKNLREESMKRFSVKLFSKEGWFLEKFVISEANKKSAEIRIKKLMVLNNIEEGATFKIS